MSEKNETTEPQVRPEQPELDDTQLEEVAGGVNCTFSECDDTFGFVCGDQPIGIGF